MLPYSGLSCDILRSFAKELRVKMPNPLLERLPVRQFGRFAAFLSRGVLGGYPPAVWWMVALFWRIRLVYLRIEGDLRTHQTALADIYLALPPR